MGRLGAVHGLRRTTERFRLLVLGAGTNGSYRLRIHYLLAEVNLIARMLTHGWLDPSPAEFAMVAT